MKHVLEPAKGPSYAAAFSTELKLQAVMAGGRPWAAAIPGQAAHRGRGSEAGSRDRGRSWSRCLDWARASTGRRASNLAGFRTERLLLCSWETSPLAAARSPAWETAAGKRLTFSHGPQMPGQQPPSPTPADKSSPPRLQLS